MNADDHSGTNFLYYLPPAVKDQALSLICGKELGRGISRTVYVFAPDSSKVVKIEHNQLRNQNASEYSFWCALKDHRQLERWFARVYLASEANSLILQERTQPVTLAELKAKCPKVPRLFSDLKVGNWGRIGRRYVCHDYGTALVTEHGLNNGSKLRKADWWE